MKATSYNQNEPFLRYINYITSYTCSVTMVGIIRFEIIFQEVLTIKNQVKPIRRQERPTYFIMFRKGM